MSETNPMLKHFATEDALRTSLPDCFTQETEKAASPLWKRQEPQPTPPPPPAIAGSVCWLPQGGLIHLDWSTHTQRWEAFMVITVPLPGIASDNIAGAENAAAPALIAEFERKLAELRAYCDTQKSEVPYA